MPYYNKLCSSSLKLLCCAAVIIGSTAPSVLAQVGQSELIAPGGPDEETVQASGGDWNAGANPGKGWMPSSTSSTMTRPGARFGGGQPAPQQAVAPMPQQPVMQQQFQQAQQMQGDQFGDNNGAAMGWTDIPKKPKMQPQMQAQMAPQGQSELISPTAGAAGSAFSTPGDTQPPWVLPSAQQDMQQGQWQTTLPQQKAAQAKPAAKAGAKTASAKAAAKPAAAQLSGQVSESSATSQFNPSQAMGGMGGMNGMSGMSGGMNGMAGGMSGMAGGMDQSAMGGMGGGSAMGGMGAGSAMGGMGAMSGMGGMGAMCGMCGMGGMGGMSGMSALGTLMGGGGGGGSPLDMIGKAIGTAAQMGLIPGTAKPGMPNVPPGMPGYGAPMGSMGAPMGSMGAPMGAPMGGMQQGTITQQPQPRRPMPGSRAVKQTGHTLGRAIQRNINYAINATAGRGMSRAMMGW